VQIRISNIEIRNKFENQIFKCSKQDLTIADSSNRRCHFAGHLYFPAKKNVPPKGQADPFNSFKLLRKRIFSIVKDKYDKIVDVVRIKLCLLRVYMGNVRFKGQGNNSILFFEV